MNAEWGYSNLEHGTLNHPTFSFYVDYFMGEASIGSKHRKIAKQGAQTYLSIQA